VFALRSHAIVDFVGATRKSSRALVAAVLDARANGLRDYAISRAIVPATGDPLATNRARQRLTRALRERVRRTKQATRRGAEASPQCTSPLVPSDAAAQDGAAMYRKRIVIKDEWRDAPMDQIQSDLGDVEELNADEAHDRGTRRTICFGA
jgi:hypothetical protein